MKNILTTLILCTSILYAHGNGTDRTIQLILNDFPLTHKDLDFAKQDNQDTYFKLLAKGNLNGPELSTLESLHNNIGTLVRQLQNLMVIITFEKKLIDPKDQAEAQSYKKYNDYAQATKARCFVEYFELLESLNTNHENFKKAFGPILKQIDNDYANMFPRENMITKTAKDAKLEETREDSK